MNKVIINETEYGEAIKRTIELAQCLLASNEDYLDNVLEINRLGHELVSEVWGTEFHVFGVIASATDHLPTKKVRPYCSESMQTKSDEELENIIKFYKADVSHACHEILAKYENV